MNALLPTPIINLANRCPAPLYVVGGFVRDFLSGVDTKKSDVDLCAPLGAEEFSKIAQALGFDVRSVYANTGTVKLCDENGNEYEYACFRSDKYVRGKHVPDEIFFTNDIRLDALRRDFTTNAVYYDIKKEKFVDPLDGIAAIKEKRFTTVDRPEKVFGEDGLRLMRLARQAAQLGFTPDNACLLGAKKNAALIKDIVPERIFTELTAILHAEERHGVKNAAQHGLTVLEETGVLALILPELALGKGIAQRADFHKYDMLTHSLKAVSYAAPSVRLAALLHDVGKPFCFLRDGNVHAHPTEGAKITKEILNRLKAPNKIVSRVTKLVKFHMYDFNCETNEPKLRRFFVTNIDILDDLMKLKQADFSACKDDTSVCPTNVKWQALLDKMREEKTPFSLKELAVNGLDVLEQNVPPKFVGAVLKALLMHVAVFPNENEPERLKRLIPSALKTVESEMK